MDVGKGEVTGKRRVVEVSAVAQPEDVPVEAVGVEGRGLRGCGGVGDGADGVGDWGDDLSDGDVPVRVVFEDEGRCCLGVDYAAGGRQLRMKRNQDDNNPMFQLRMRNIGENKHLWRRSVWASQASAWPSLGR